MSMLENFRIAVGVQTFYMAGHSFGGYLAGLYAYYYPHSVKKLYLISPSGVLAKCK